METSKARLVRVERTPPTSPPPSTRRSTQRQTLRLVIIDIFPTQISNTDSFEAGYHICAKSKCFSTEPQLIGQFFYKKYNTNLYAEHKLDDS